MSLVRLWGRVSERVQIWIRNAVRIGLVIGLALFVMYIPGKSAFLLPVAIWLTAHKDLFPLIAPALLLFTFTIDRYIAYKLLKKETYRSWYLKTLIDPHLEEIETFFSEVPALYKSSHDTLKRCRRNSTDDYLALQTKLNASFQQKKQKLDYEFVTIVAYNNKTIAKNITDVFNRTEDIFTTNLDQLTDDFEKVNRDFALCKAQLYAILAQPLE